MTHLTSTEMCKRTDVTYRQLDYWVNSGYITPEIPGIGSGQQRKWGEHQIVTLRKLRDIMNAKRVKLDAWQKNISSGTPTGTPSA
jgi:DNA-binding transcriptional MerR regulator